MNPNIVFAVLLSAAAVEGARAADYHESGDAGSTPAFAQDVALVGAFEAIAGRLDHAFDVDLFRLVIDDPGSFSAVAEPVDGGAPHPQIFLFDELGYGIVGSDDTMSSALPAIPVDRPPGQAQYRLRDGYHRYYISVALGFSHVPVSERPYFELGAL